MKPQRYYWLLIASLGIIFFVYRAWFFKGPLTAPDFFFLFPDRMLEYEWIPRAWSSMFNNGLGGSTVQSLNLDVYVSFGIKLFTSLFHASWSLTSRLLFFWPFLCIGISGSFFLAKKILADSRLAILSALLYLTNTYILMIAGGGQVGLMLAYAVAPWVVAGFIGRLRVLFTVSSILFIMLDIRYAYALYPMLLLWFLLAHPVKAWMKSLQFYLPCVPWILAAHLYWLIPFVTSPTSALPAGYGDSGWLAYLSWADFSKTLSLLHPNWPENIFGKTYFMRPEFLGIPLLAFSSLVWLGSDNKINEGTRKTIRFFFIMGLIGAFLGKGIQGPFGGIYAWMFAHVPLFSGFRDPTKFYLLTALSYSLLIPFSCQYVGSAAVKKMGGNVKLGSTVGILIVLFFWSITLIPALNGRLRGTFRVSSVPQEYELLAQKIGANKEFSRILAVPFSNRYLYQTENHPVLDARTMYQVTDTNAILADLADPASERRLRGLSIRYVIIPKDTEHEIFLTERMYDESIREKYRIVLDHVSYLTKNESFKNLDVYELKNSPGQVYRWLDNGFAETIPSQRVSNSRYTVSLPTRDRPVTITLSESFHPSWVLWDGTIRIHGKKSENGMTEFTLGPSQPSVVSVYFEGNERYKTSFMATIGALMVLLLFVVFRNPKGRIYGVRTVMVLVLGTGVAYGWHYLNRAHDLLALSVPMSADWRKTTDKQTRQTGLMTEFGGSEIGFIATNARWIRLSAVSANNTPNEQGLEIWIGNSRYRYSSPFNNRVFTMPVTTKTAPIRIRSFCDSSLTPCEIHITSLQTNKESVITEDPTFKKPVLTVFGDSISTSFGMENYSYMLADRMGYRLHNASVFGSSVTAVPGWDSASGRVDADINRFPSDITLLFLGTNDLGRGVNVPEFERNYETLLSSIKHAHPGSHLVCMGLLYRNDADRTTILSYSRAIYTVASRNGCTYLDPINWLGSSSLTDGVHPNRASESIMADKIYLSLQSILKR